MRKKLSPDALDILAVAAISGWRMRGNELEPVAELVNGGLITSEDVCGIVVLLPTTAGVQHLVRSGVVVQNGIRFILADGFELKRTLERSATPAAAPQLRVVEPKAPDPFKEGMDAAIAGKPRGCHPEYIQAEADDWAAGYDAGLTVKKSGIV